MDPVVSNENAISTGPPGGGGAEEGPAFSLLDGLDSVSSSLTGALAAVVRFPPPLPLPVAVNQTLSGQTPYVIYTSSQVNAHAP